MWFALGTFGIGIFSFDKIWEMDLFLRLIILSPFYIWLYWTSNKLFNKEE